MAAHPVSDAVEPLLAELAWLRSLAVRLARDGSDADDAIQETWMAALRTPPAADRPPRPWLMAVLRRAFPRRGRTDQRRRSREEAAAIGVPESQESAAEAVERVELHRLVAQFVSALEEPYRSAIVSRFFEGRSGAEIARQSGIPEGTVRWRISEGLRRLRACLDERSGGDRKWRSLALAAAPGSRAEGPASQAFWKGAFAMKLGSKPTIGALVVLLFASVTVISTGARWNRPGDEGEASAARAPGDRPPSATGGSGRTSATKEPLPPPRFLAPSLDESAERDHSTPRSKPSLPVPAIPLDRRYDLTREELEALARNCELRPDLPGVVTVNDVPMGWLEEKELVALHLRSDELPVTREALRDYRNALNDLGRRWYVEVTADPDGARGLDFLDFSNPDHPSIQRMATRLTLRQISEGAGLVAQELAGRSAKDPPPSDPIVASVAAFYRREYALADQFEQRLGRSLGPARARELRRGGIAGRTRRAGCP